MQTRTYTTLEKRHTLERANSYLENNQVSRVEWWRRFGAAACQTRELLAQYLETALTILNENCWSTDTNMCNIGKMTDVSKRRLVPSSLKDPIPIWSYNATILKGSYWCTDKNIHDIGKTANFKKRKFVPWKSLRLQSRSAKVLRSCCMHTTGTEISVWKVICTIVKGSCQSIDKNMCKVDITNYFDSVKFCLLKPRKCY